MTAAQQAETTLRALKYWLDGTPEIRHTKSFCDSERVSIDVGANIGQFTWWMRRYSKSVVAYEPIPALADRLEASFSSKVQVRRAAASASTGQAELAIPLGPEGERASSASLAHSFDEQRTVVVDLERIDDLDVGPIGYIKIDVEGHELDVLDGARATLERDRPVLLVEIELRHQDGEIRSKVEQICSVGYEATFLFENRFRPFSEFSDDMQDQTNIGTPSKYINNFVFRRSG